MIPQIRIDFHTLEEARQHLRDNWHEGVACPCCRQNVKLWKRSMNKSMAYGLIVLYRLHQKYGFDTYFKMNEEIARLKIPSSNVEYPKNRYFGLMEEEINKKTNKTHSGWWKLTPKGVHFVLGNLKTNSWVKVFNNKVYEKSNRMIDIKEALTIKFDYDKLMNE